MRAEWGSVVQQTMLGSIYTGNKYLEQIDGLMSAMVSYPVVGMHRGNWHPGLQKRQLPLVKRVLVCSFRVRLASGLKIAHQQLGNIQLVSQYLTILGTLALQLHDTEQAREILKSSLTLAKTLYDVPTQIWVLSVLTGMRAMLDLAD
ncbi:hypothetical protein MA16_Dca022188 [Dendrobium catenatum]|uniref:Uncharacterized protein n=1 Tax=Dendrobium catenatum TaxID=906689 RepID=A0A2I0VGH2_9ASPA|nr:hypothetical protein MA16_Dca022188 [Dendrobium catenatum]